MKKLMRKKQHEELNLRQLKQVTDAIPDSSKDKNVTKENLNLQRGKKTSLLRKDKRNRMSQSEEQKHLNLHFNNPDFNKYDSVSLDQVDDVNTPENSISDDNKIRKGLSDIAETGGIFGKDAETSKLKTFPQKSPEPHLRFKDRLDQPTQALLLKNADEKTDFSLSNCSLTREADLQYAAERLRLTEVRKSNSDFFRRQDIYYNESLFNDINVMESQDDAFVRIHKNSQRSVPFQRRKKMLKGLDKFVIRKEQKETTENALRKSFHLNEPQIPIFYVKKEIKKEESNRTYKNDNDIENENIEMIKDELVDYEVTEQEDFETKQYLLDFFLYIIHLIFITMIALSMMSSDMYYFTDVTASMFLDIKSFVLYSNLNTTQDNDNPASASEATKKNSPTNGTNVISETYLLNEIDATNETMGDIIFNVPMICYQEKSLRESRTVEDFWAFAESTLIYLLYWNFFYSRMDPLVHTKDDDKKMFYENQILGVARLRQVRVRNDSCQIHPDVKRFFDTCYFYYSVFSEETRPIKEGMENSSTSTAWVYTEAETLGTSSYWGEISIYGGGGYYVDLGLTKEDSLEMIKDLKKNNWLSRATRAVFIDFNIYNANVNLFCLCRIILEFSPVGGMIPRVDFQSLKLIRYLTVFDFFILGCEFVYALFVIYFTWKLIETAIKQKISFFFSLWNYLEIFTIILSCIYIVLSVVRYFYAAQLISTLDDRYYKYTEFHSLKEMQITYNNVIAIITFCGWMKMFMYFNFNRIMLHFRTTLARSLADILGFSPMFLTVFLAFAFLAHLLFGNQVKDYSTVWYSFLTLLQAFLGKFDFHNIAETNQVLGPIFYMAFIFFVYFALLNVFLAIIINVYSTVRSQVLLNKPRTGEYIQRGFSNFFFCFRPRIQKKSVLNKSKKKLLFKNIQEALKRAGFSSKEIKLFFYKYNINYDNFLGQKSKRNIIKDVEFKRTDYSETSEQAQINTLRRKLDNLREKMDNFQMNLQPIVDKIDILLNRL